MICNSTKGRGLRPPAGGKEKTMNHDKKDSGSKNNKDKGKFHSKNIKHDPNAESARAVFGLNNNTKNKD